MDVGRNDSVPSRGLAVRSCGRTCSGNEDSAFDGDVDIGIGLVFAAMQWPEFVPAATNWISKMECEVNSVYDGKFNYPTPGDTWDKNCQNYPGQPCGYQAGNVGQVNMSYYPPGYFRVFGDFLASHLDPSTSTPAPNPGAPGVLVQDRADRL